MKNYNQLPASVTNYMSPENQSTDMGLSVGKSPIAPVVPRTIVNPNVKDSGAPVAFSPKASQAINSVFGMPIDQSYDRAMDPISTTQGQAI